MNRQEMIDDYASHPDCPHCHEALAHVIADENCVGECAPPSECTENHDEHSGLWDHSERYGGF